LKEVKEASTGDFNARNSSSYSERGKGNFNASFPVSGGGQSVREMYSISPIEI
jgi:hypothetical protein